MSKFLVLRKSDTPLPLTFILSLFFSYTIGISFYLKLNPYILLPFSLVVSIVYYFRNAFSGKVLVMECAVLAITLSVPWLLIDNTYDGNCYHLPIHNYFQEGWNPYYSKYLVGSCERWINYYPKFVEFSRYGFYLIKEQFLFIVNISFFLASFLVMRKMILLFMRCSSLKLNILAGVLTVTGTVTVQLFNTYIDGVIGSLILILIYFVFISIKEKKWYLLTSLLIGFAINTKFTTPLMLMPLGFYIAYGILKRKVEAKYITSLLVTVCLAIGVFGRNPFYTNYKEFDHPLHPVMGPSKINIIDHFLVGELHNDSYVMRYLKSHLATPTNARFSPGVMSGQLSYSFIDSLSLVPFTVPDTVIGGHGPLYKYILLMFLLSLVYFIVMLFIRRNFTFDKFSKYLILVFLVSVLIVGVHPGSFWARYFPHLPSISLMLVLVLHKKFKTSISKYLSIILVLLSAINSLFLVYVVSRNQYELYNIRQRHVSLLEKNRDYKVNVYYPFQDKIYGLDIVKSDCRDFYTLNPFHLGLCKNQYDENDLNNKLKSEVLSIKKDILKWLR